MTPEPLTSGRSGRGPDDDHRAVCVPHHLGAHGAEQQRGEPAVAAGADNDKVGLVGQLPQDAGRLPLEQLSVHLHRRRVAGRLDRARETLPGLLLEHDRVGQPVRLRPHAARETAVGDCPDHDGAHIAAAMYTGLGNSPSQSLKTRCRSIDAHDVSPRGDRLLFGHLRSLRPGLGAFLISTLLITGPVVGSFIAQLQKIADLADQRHPRVGAMTGPGTRSWPHWAGPFLASTTLRRQIATFATIDEYISSFPDDVQIILREVRQAILNAAPAADETISYQIPTITLSGRNLVHFAAWKHHIGLYPIPTADEAFEQKIAPYRAARGTARFPLQKPIPYDLIERVAGLLVEQRT